MKSTATALTTAAALLLLTMGLSAGAATPASPQQVVVHQGRPAKELSPADKAFDEALKSKEPQARLLAFQKLKKDWPDSPAVKNGAADFNILAITTDLVRSAATEARRAADSYASHMPRERDRSAWQHMLLALKFDATGAMWPETERHARKALEAWDSGGLQQPPKEMGIELERAVPLALLGKAIARQGRDEEAEHFLRSAYDARAGEPGVITEVVPELIAIAKRRGNAADHMEWLLVAALYGQLTPERRTELEGLYRAVHGGSLDGLEAMLDARYERELPASVTVEPFRRPASDTARIVLTEMFTGAFCSPCVGMDLALEAALRRYQTKDLAVLVYHMHSPSQDPLTNPSGEARATSYGVRGAPQLLVDGLPMDDEGGGKASEAAAIFESRLQPSLDKALQQPAGARVTLRVSRRGSEIRASVRAANLPKNRGDLALHVALVEERVRYSGGNGIRFHPMVVRKMANDGQGLKVPATGEMKSEFSFDTDAITTELDAYLDRMEKGTDRFEPFTFGVRNSRLDPARLLVVAFVQESSSRRVLQAAVAPVSPKG